MKRGTGYFIKIFQVVTTLVKFWQKYLEFYLKAYMRPALLKPNTFDRYRGATYFIFRYGCVITLHKLHASKSFMSY
jgi:hypothetical protein